MNVRAILLSSVVRALGTKSVVYVPAIINALHQRYGFVRVPTSAAEILPPENTPVILSHGNLVHDGRTIVIQSLKLYSRAAIAETVGATEDSERVIDDVFDCLATTIGYDVSEPGTNRIYGSQLEIGLEVSLEGYFYMLHKIGAVVAEAMGRYGITLPPLQLYSLGMNIDPTMAPLICDFRIERRVGVPYEAGVYFSQAPLRTSDHVSALEEFERTMRDVTERLEKSGLPSPPPVFVASRGVP